MAEYIEREAVLERLAKQTSATGLFGAGVTLGKDFAEAVVRAVPAADVVPKPAFDQVIWERDVAIAQLREDYGVGLGEKKAADVVEVKHGRWETEIDYDEFWGDLDYYKCSLCGHRELRDAQTPYCPNCGARMDGE